MIHYYIVQQKSSRLMTTYYYITILLILTHFCSAQDGEVVLLTESESWGFGILTGFGLSLIGFAAAILLVCIQKCFSEAFFKVTVNMMYALGCGAMIGDAMIHILPEAYTNDEVNTNFVSLAFICAIAFFLFIERIFESFGIAHQHWGEDQAHLHQHDHQVDKTDSLQNRNVIEQALLSKENVCGLREDLSQLVQTHHIGNVNSKKADQPHSEKTCLQNLRGKGSAGYLNLLSSFIHNFFDGFAVGVAFASKDKHVFIPVIVAIFAHEIPREMGDVGILLKSGFSNMQTVLCNGLINFISLFGVIAGLALGTIDEAAQVYVLVFVAGNFIYIGADIWRHLLRNKIKIINFLEIVMFALGVGAMYLVLLAESDDQH